MSQKLLISFVRQEISRHRKLAGKLVGSLLILAVAQAVFLFFAKSFLEFLFTLKPHVVSVPASQLLPARLAVYFPNLPDIPVAPVTLALPAVLLIAGLVKSLGGYWFTRDQQLIAIYAAKSLREHFFRRMLALSYRQLSAQSPATWMSQIMNDIQFIQNRISDALMSFVRGGVQILACMVAMFFIHVPSAVVLLFIAPILALLLGRTGKRISRYTIAFQHQLSRLMAALLDVRARFEFIKAQHGDTTEEKRLLALNESYYTTMRRSILIRSVFAPAVELFGFLVLAGLIWMVANVELGENFGKNIVQFFVAVGAIIKPLRDFGEQLSRWQESVGTMERMQCATTPDPTLTMPNQLVAANHFSGFTIHQMTANYGKDRPTVEVVNLVFAPGKSVALVGASGSGKTTLMNVLCGLLRPDRFDASLPLEEVVSASNLVSQSPFLFDDTLKANLTYGLADKTVADQTLSQALEDFALADIVATHIDGLQRRMNALASSVSGGQLQRLAIVRAYLRQILLQKSLWVLDEPGAALDPHVERDVTQLLLALAKKTGRAMLYSTHRMGLLHLFDEVWFMREGRIAEKAPHDELLKRSQAYSRFVSAGGA